MRSKEQLRNEFEKLMSLTIMGEFTQSDRNNCLFEWFLEKLKDERGEWERFQLSELDRWKSKYEALAKGYELKFKKFSFLEEHPTVATDGTFVVNETLEQSIEKILVEWLKSDNENATYCAYLIALHAVVPYAEYYALISNKQ